MAARVHLRQDGTWAPCQAKTRACPRLFHLPGTLAQVQQLPSPILLDLLSVIEPPSIITPDGARVWQNNFGQSHREHDLPAEIGEDGILEWYRHGLLHRAYDRPAIVFADGSVTWCQDGLQHREGAPADIFLDEDGDTEYNWYWRGERHRTDGPAIHFANSTSEEWWVHGERHRIGGPAQVLPNGEGEYWYEHDQLHRDGGLPAIILAAGRCEWWTRGQQVDPPPGYSF